MRRVKLYLNGGSHPRIRRNLIDKASPLNVEGGEFFLKKLISGVILAFLVASGLVGTLCIQNVDGLELWRFSFSPHPPAMHLLARYLEITYLHPNHTIPSEPIDMDINLEELVELGELGEIWIAPLPFQESSYGFVEVTRTNYSIISSFEFVHPITGHFITADLNGTIVGNSVSFIITYHLPPGLQHYSRPLNYEDAMSEMDGNLDYSLPEEFAALFEGTLEKGIIAGTFTASIAGQIARWYFRDEEWVVRIAPGGFQSRDYLWLNATAEWVLSNFRLHGDFIVDAVWIKKGDILLGYGTKLVPGYWSHVGMYIGEGQVIESHAKLGGVAISSLENWMDRYETWAVLRVVTADEETINRAVSFTLDQKDAEAPYDWVWWQKDPDGEAWYCSELVWAAYLHASDGEIDIEYHGPGEIWESGITPDEILMDEETMIIVEHHEETRLKGLVIRTECPVNLEVVDPDGFSASKQLMEIEGGIYGEDDSNADGSPDDWIGIPKPKPGYYSITVVPEVGASPTDTYTLIVDADNTTMVLAANISISDIPSQHYVYEYTMLPSEPIHIRADGAIDPRSAPIVSYHNITYSFTDSICASLVLERDNIVLDGAGYVVQGVGSGKGIDITGRHNVTVNNLQVEDFFYGLWLSNTSNCRISKDYVEGSRYGIRIEHSSNIVLSENNITANDLAIVIHHSHGNNITYNSIWNNFDQAIWLKNCTRNRIFGNNIKDNDCGIDLSLEVSDSYLYQNNLVNNGFYGMWLESCTNNTIFGNNITKSVYGIGLRHSSENTISKNNIIDNRNFGVWMWNSSINSIYGNTIAYNFYGFWLNGSSNNNVYHNNIINNTVQVYTYMSTNTWDDGFPSGGNYWSDCEDRYPNATEIDDSGIWDTPYVIDDYSQDNYPLVPEFPTWTSMLLILIVLTVAIAIYRRRLSKTPIY